jgi:type IV secretory pathway TraG/TraD family ATPase VirD4
MRAPLWALVASAFIVGLTIFTILSSLLFLILTGLYRVFPHPYTAWWWYFWYYRSDDTTIRLLAISGIPVLILELVAGGIAAIGIWSARHSSRRRPLYGTTRWASREDRERGGFRGTKGLR